MLDLNGGFIFVGNIIDSIDVFIHGSIISRLQKWIRVIIYVNKKIVTLAIAFETIKSNTIT